MFNLTFVFVIILTLAGGTGYMYYQNSQQEKAVLIAEAAINNTKIALQEQALKQADADVRKINKILNSLEDKFKRSQEDYDRLVSRFNKLSINFGTRDIGKLAENKPGLIARVITRASARALRCFEILSGSPLTNDEINATKPSQINSECPTIANPNYHPKED
tara:strand:+ start:216 stop:704 length:489 start_codon:yes stop_codon:yes gene_type:complete